MPVKMVVVIRKDLGMRQGKACSQAGHAFMGSFLNSSHQHGDTLTVSLSKAAQEWLAGNNKKVTLQVPSLEDIQELARLADANDIPFYVVTDAGLTEFNGVPTITAIGLGPHDEAELDKITGDLKLL